MAIDEPDAARPFLITGRRPANDLRSTRLQQKTPDRHHGNGPSGACRFSGTARVISLYRKIIGFLARVPTIQPDITVCDRYGSEQSKGRQRHVQDRDRS
jgi:hypothetical protein